VCRLVLETAIGPVLPLLEGKDREARWDSAAATGGVTQNLPCNRADRQGPAPPRWRGAQRSPTSTRLAGETLAKGRSMEGPAAPTPQRSL
jgi:hypothetical protein